MKYCAITGVPSKLHPRHHAMNNYVQAITYLDSFIDYEQKAFFPYRHTFKLARVHALMRALAIVPEKLAVLHIAGTKGKGSTAAFCAYMLAAGGFRVGLYTSPHFFDFRERIQILRRETPASNSWRGLARLAAKPRTEGGREEGRRKKDKGRPRNTRYAIRNTKNEGRPPAIAGEVSTKAEGTIVNEMIAQSDMVRLLEKMRPRLERLRCDQQFGNLSFFEVYTALAFMYFLEKKVDYVVLETGLGGRLDATNVVAPIVSIITRIGLDHTDKLGTTLARIASEKAGIIKPRIPVVSAAQNTTVAALLKQRARALDAPFFIYGRDFHALNVRYHKKQTTFDFSFGTKKLSRCRVSLAGSHQVANASLALAAVELMQRQGFSLSDESMREGLCAAYIAGRFETLQHRPLVVADIAHNPLAFDTLAKNLKLYFPDKKIILIFAASRDKDVRNMVNKIKSRHIILTSFNNPRACTPLEIKTRCQLTDACCVSSVDHAYAVAARCADKNSLILISGSLFLVAEAKKFLEAL